MAEIIKIIVDGRGGVGKTTLLKSLIERNFDPYTSITIGVDFFSKKYHLFGHNINVQFWDMGGVSRFDFLRSVYYRGANCLVLVGDLTRSTSFEAIDYFINIAKEANIDPNQIILVGNKSDLFDRSIAPSYLTFFVEKFNLADLIETSARFMDNLDAIFELAVLISINKKGIINNVEFKQLKEDLSGKIWEPILNPSQKIIRKCWNCSRSLFFSEFSYTNATLNRDRLIELWENKYIQFLCCNCFKKFNK